MLALATTFFRRCLLLVLLLGGLEACQRTGYQLQAVESAAYPAIAPAPVAESAVIIALPPAAQPSASHFPKAYRPQRRSARPPRISRATPAPLPRQAAATASVAARVPQQRQEPISGPVRYRSRVIAGLLAFLTIPFGLHNFYLGYYGRGAISVGLVVLSFYLMAAGSIGFLFGVASATTPIFYLGIAMLLFAAGWQVSDMLRIGNGSLLPKNGAYRAKQPSIKPLN